IGGCRGHDEGGSVRSPAFFLARHAVLLLTDWRSADATAVYFDESKSCVCSFYTAGTKRGHRQLSLIFDLLNLQRAGLIDPIDAALDEPLVPRRFPQSTPLQHSQKPCEWQTRWQVSSPSSRRPIPHGGLSRG